VSQEVLMSLESLEARMDRLERRIDLLEQLPQRMDALALQIVQLREEMRSEFSAIRTEIRDAVDQTERTLSTQMRELFEANETHMRVLHEDLVQRIATIKGG
jgi:thiamine kinase-like enzyme